MPALELTADGSLLAASALSAISKEIATHLGSASGWPDAIRIQFALGKEFSEEPRQVEESGGAWRGRMDIDRNRWDMTDDKEHQRIIAALAIKVLLQLGARKSLPLDALHAARKSVGRLDIVGGGILSSEYKAWIAARRAADPEFDAMCAEDEGNWDNPDNAHPEAQRILKWDWAWDIVDEHTPFGNDTGWDMMEELVEWLDENPDADPTEFFEEILDSYDQGMDWNSLDDDELAEIVEDEDQSLTTRDDLVLAFAFGTLILQGNVPAAIRDHALGAARRHQSPAMKDFAWPADTVKEMIEALEAAPTR
jgi:uncharacterized protein YfeS